MIYFISILIVYGFSNIIVYGSIFEPFRKLVRGTVLGQLTNCMMCTSFHIGWLFSLTFVSILGSVLPPDYSVFGIELMGKAAITIADAVFFSGTTWLIHTIQERIETD